MGIVGAVFAVGALPLTSLFCILGACVYITRATKSGPAAEIAFSKWLASENYNFNLTNDLLASHFKGTKELLNAILIPAEPQGERTPSPDGEMSDSTSSSQLKSLSLQGEPDEDDHKSETGEPAQSRLKNWSPALFQAAGSDDNEQPGMTPATKTALVTSRPTI